MVIPPGIGLRVTRQIAAARCLRFSFHWSRLLWTFSVEEEKKEIAFQFPFLFPLLLRLLSEIIFFT